MKLIVEKLNPDIKNVIDRIVNSKGDLDTKRAYLITKRREYHGDDEVQDYINKALDIIYDRIYERNLKEDFVIDDKYEDAYNYVKQMAIADAENGQVLSIDDISLFRDILKDDGYDITNKENLENLFDYYFEITQE